MPASRSRTGGSAIRAPSAASSGSLAAAALDLGQHARGALAIVDDGRGGDAGMERRLGHPVGRNSRRRIAPQSCDRRNTLSLLRPTGLLRGDLAGGGRVRPMAAMVSASAAPSGSLLAASRACSTASAKCARGSSPASIGSTTPLHDRGPVGEAALVGVGVAADQRGSRHHLARRRRIDGERALDELEPALHPRLLLGKAQRARPPALAGPPAP